MKKHINFFLDESGNVRSEFFTVAGFFILSEDKQEILKIKQKIESNILDTEKAIKEYRRDNQPDEIQFIKDEETKVHIEVKWRSLTYDNKKFLFDQLSNFGQINVSITSNLRKWKTSNRGVLNLDAVYNVMVLYLIERTLNRLNINQDDEFQIEVYIDQRRVAPKFSASKIKMDGLESYIKTTWFLNCKYLKSTISITQLDSFSNPLIRYSDYFSGLINSMCRFLNNSSRDWDRNMDILFTVFHQKNNCCCYSTIKDQCEIITKLCNLCSFTPFLNLIKPPDCYV